MNSAGDRRAPGATRIPFDGMVEVGGTLGPTFEAQALTLSEEGMSLRTAYLPEVGQPIRCRFEAGHGLSIMAAGEVIWNEDLGEGGEFGIRFTNVDAPSTVALQRVMGMAEEGILPRPPQGRKVRLHIEGLASPMRARLRGTHASCATAYSELGFLEMGKPLELEDAMSGNRRPALIDRVDVAMEDGSRIPQLVVTLRYDDEEARMATQQNEQAGSLSAVTIEEQTGRDAMAPEPYANEDDEMVPPPLEASAHEHDEEDVIVEAKASEEGSDSDDVAAESEKLKSPLARTAAKITPAMMSFAKRAKVTMALFAAKIAAKRGGSGDDVEIPMRRTTAPAPGGGLHASGRKVIRGEVGEEKSDDEKPKKKFEVTKRKAAIAGAIGVAGILAIVAMRKPAEAPPLAAVPPADTAATAAPSPAPSTPAPGVNDPLANAALAGTPGPNGMMSTGMKNGKPAPFTNGSVGVHGNVIRIKMDGQIAAIQGASQPTGFTVVIPSRKSMDAAGPLASKDPRIAQLKVANEPTGAELAVSFKDGVPNYAVRAKGDVLELVLAKPSANGDKPAEAKAGHAGSKKKNKKH